MRWSELVGRIRERGQYPTTQAAERVALTVLAALGGHLAAPERSELAGCLPAEAAAVLAGRHPVPRRRTAAEFVDLVAGRMQGATSATARWDVSSVLGVVADLAEPALLNRVLDRLPPGYALLFGRAQLSPAGVATPA